MIGGDFDSPNDTYPLNVVFGPATQDHVIAKHRDAAGSRIQVLTDLEFTGGGDGDFAVDELGGLSRLSGGDVHQSSVVPMAE